MKRFIIIFFLLTVVNLGYTQDYRCSGYYRFLNENKIREDATHHLRAADLSSNYNLKYSRFNWKIDPDTNYIAGRVTHYFSPVNSKLDVIEFELGPTLIVDSIIYHSINIPSSHTNYLLSIQLPDTVTVPIDSITIVYHGKPTSGGGSFEQSLHGNDPIIWTLSEPYGARDWWPCKQILTDKIDSIDVFIETPLKNKAASNGKLISVTKIDSTHIFYWKHRYPIAAYLVAVAITNYAAFSDYAHYEGDSVEILNYIYPEDLAYYRPAIDRTAAIMEVYMEKFGRYPFFKEKYGHAEFGRNGGMEHQTMSFMGFFNDMLIGHEMAHQWFGDKVTCGSWSDIWLNESFATYAEEITYEYLYPKQDMVNWRKLLISRITSQPGGSVYVYGNDTNYEGRVFDQRLSYHKGGMVLQMLRHLAGDSAFFTAIQNFLNDPKIAYGYAKTADFIKHIEATSGKDLTKFFNDWIYLEGYPTYTIKWKQIADNVNIDISQITSHHTVSFFELPVPLLLKGKGRDSLIVLTNNINNQKFNVNVDFIVDSVFFDPDYILISRNSKVINETIPDKRLIAVYPMPFDHGFRIVICNQAIDIRHIEIFDLNGKLLEDRNFGQKIYLPGNSIDMNTTIIHPGQYIMRIITSDKSIIYPIIKATGE